MRLFIRSRALISLAIALTLIGGYIAAEWNANQTDEDMRASLLAEGISIARTLNYQEAYNLSFSKADKEQIDYIRFSNQFKAYAKFKNFRGIYTMALRGDKIHFGPESYESADPLSSEPGDVYQEPPLELHSIFKSGLPHTSGPYKDEFGNFISAFVPLKDPRTRDIIMIIGVDIEAKEWEQALFNAKLFPFFFALFFALLLLICLIPHSKTKEAETRMTKNRASCITAIICLTITFAVVFLAHENETRSRKVLLEEVSGSAVHTIKRELQNIRDHRLASLVKFYESSEFVTREEFKNFSKPFTQNAYIQTLSWLPLIPLSDREKFEAETRKEGLTDYFIYELNDKGEKVPVAKRSVYFPALYAEPFEENKEKLGYDVYSDPIRGKAIKRALTEGRRSAADPIPLSDGKKTENAFGIFFPVSSEPKGVVAVLLRLESLLKEVLAEFGNEREFVEIHFYRLKENNEAEWLASSANCSYPLSINETSFVFPLLIFGNAYLLAAKPTPEFFKANPVNSGLTAALVGLLLTLLLSMFVGFLVNQKSRLEREVLERTSELYKSEARFSSIFELPLVGSVISSLDGKFISVNDRFCEIVGYTREELDKITWADITPKEELAREIEAYQKALSGEIQGNEIEKHYIRKDGSLVYVHVSAMIVNKSDGAPDYVVALVKDITEKKKAEEEREKLQEQLLHSQKMEAIGRLAGGMAHDFNNMLLVITLYADMAMKNAQEDPKMSKYLSEIKIAAERSSQLTRQLLAFARKQAIKPKILDINVTIANMFKMLGRMVGEEINLIWQPGEDIGKIKIDPSQLDQILANLVVNARDAIGGVGKIVVETKNIEFDKEYCRLNEGFTPGKYVLLEVSDDGCGMDKETQSCIFEPFFTTKKHGEGTGLGLPTVYGIVKQNEGFIKVYSEPGAGTSFKIYFRIVEEKGTEVSERPISHPLRGGAETILLVEDEEALLKLQKGVLEQLGYKVLAAQDPSEALKIAEEYSEKIHLVITDVVLPGMNGKELSNRLSKIKPDIKCLYMSGYTANVILHRGVLEEGINFIQKPFSIEEFSAKIRESISKETQKNV